MPLDTGFTEEIEKGAAGNRRNLRENRWVDPTAKPGKKFAANDRLQEF